MSEIQYFPLNTLVKRVKVGFVGSIDDYYCNKNNGVRLYRTTNLTDGRLSDNDVKYVTYDFHQRNKKSQLHRNDILIARHGDNGKACVFENDFPAHALNVVIIEPDLKKLSPYLLRYMLESEYVKRQIQGAVGGSVQGVVNTDTIANLSIPIISNIDYLTVEQILTNIDAKIANNNAICSNLEDMAKLLYDYWFVQFDFPDENGKPYKSSGGKMVWNEELKREIPEGWEVGNIINNPLTTVIGNGIDRFDKKNYLPTANVVGEFITDGDWITYDNRESRANMQPTPYSVWFAKMKNSIKHISIPENSVWFLNKYILSTGFEGIQCDEKSFGYIHCIINSDYFERHKDILAHGATQESINDDDLKNIKFVIPPSSLLDVFSKTVNIILEYKFSKIYENQHLASLRDFLLPMLMNGQVKIG